MIEHVIGYPPTKDDPLDLVERPMDPKINPALAILFLGLRQSRKTARPVGPDISMMIAGLPVELIGNERERGVIGAVKPAHDLEERPGQSSQTRWIRGKRRREVGAGKIAGRRA